MDHVEISEASVLPSSQFFFFSVRLYFGSDKRRKGLQLEALHMWTKVKDQMQEVASFPADAM